MKDADNQGWLRLRISVIVAWPFDLVWRIGCVGDKIASEIIWWGERA